MTPLLRFTGVRLRRGGRVLFDALDLEVEPGDALHVAGPNGSGKSSLIRLAAGLLSQECGAVDRGRLALADDQLALDRELPLARALRFWGVGSLEAMGLAELAHVPVRLLSAGQARRAALARVVGSGAPLWLLDEPLNALDAEASGRLHRLIESHRIAGGAVVVASHVPLPGDWRTLELGQ
jgi:heme exporter protein A